MLLTSVLDTVDKPEESSGRQKQTIWLLLEHFSCPFFSFIFFSSHVRSYFFNGFIYLTCNINICTILYGIDFCF